jgi:hypothetical protein
MTEPDEVIHILTAPWQPAFSAAWIGTCTCGEVFVGGTAQAVRDAGVPHRMAEIERLRNAPSEVESGGSDVG